MRRLFYLIILLTFLAGAVGAQTSSVPAGITKEKLEARIKELKVTREQLMANINAVSGAIQENEEWLKQLEETEKK
jgi:hypothetical protein